MFKKDYEEMVKELESSNKLKIEEIDKEIEYQL